MEPTKTAFFYKEHIKQEEGCTTFHANKWLLIMETAPFVLAMAREK